MSGFLTAMFNLSLNIVHKQGCQNNVAGLLSGWYVTADNDENLQNYVSNHIWVDAHIDLTLFNHHI